MARDEEILRVAQRLFCEHGYGSVGVDRIGSEAGVTGPAIYFHFGSKAEILAALFDQAMDRMLALAGPVRQDPVEELEHLVREHARFALGHRELLTVYLREGRALEPGARRSFHRRQRDYADRWVAALAELRPGGRRKEEIVATVHAVIGLLMSPTQWPREALAAPGLEELLAELAFDALGLNVRSAA